MFNNDRLKLWNSFTSSNWSRSWCYPIFNFSDRIESIGILILYLLFLQYPANWWPPNYHLYQRFDINISYLAWLLSVFGWCSISCSSTNSLQFGRFFISCHNKLHWHLHSFLNGRLLAWFLRADDIWSLWNTITSKKWPHSWSYPIFNFSDRIESIGILILYLLFLQYPANWWPPNYHLYQRFDLNLSSTS